MDLVSKGLAGKHRSKKTITGSMVVKFVRSPFLVWCDANAPSEERDPENKYLHLLFDRGIDHEREVVKNLYPDAKRVFLKSMESGFEQVVSECKKGVNALTGAPLFFLNEELHGVADVLLRSNDHSSVFGDYHYVVKEIKSARHMKKEYILQAALYNYIIGKLQGYTPPVFYLINREQEEFEYEFEKYESELHKTLKGIREVLSGKEVAPTAKGLRWPWENFGVKKAIEAGDVSIVPHVGPSLRRKLNARGISTAKDLMDAKDQDDITDSTWKKIKRYARAWVTKKEIVIQEPKLPDKDTELFLDFEGTDELRTEEGMVKVNYLVGVLLRKGDKVDYITFIAHSLSEEESMFKEFFNFIKEYPDAPIYHYGNYEKTHLKQVGKKYGVDVKHITKNMIDVLQVLKKSVALPTISMSLKEIGKYLGFNWRGMASAQESIVLYLNYLETKDKKILQRILDYNEDDVRATMVVKDFLAGLKG